MARVAELSTPSKVRPTVPILTEKLMRIAIAGESHDSAAGLAAARQALMDIAKLNGLGGSSDLGNAEPAPEGGGLVAVPWAPRTPMTEAEWFATFAPKD